MKTLCLTLGDPCGLGPELVVRHFAKEAFRDDERIVIIGPERALIRELERYEVAPFYEKIKQLEELSGKGAGLYLFEPPELSRLGFPAGKPVVEGGLAAGASLDDAVSLLTMRG